MSFTRCLTLNQRIRVAPEALGLVCRLSPADLGIIFLGFTNTCLTTAVMGNTCLTTA